MSTTEGQDEPAIKPVSTPELAPETVPQSGENVAPPEIATKAQIECDPSPMLADPPSNEELVEQLKALAAARSEIVALPPVNSEVTMSGNGYVMGVDYASKTETNQERINRETVGLRPDGTFGVVCTIPEGYQDALTQ